jgi:predicted GH43/DUF377 family glycosyl hydrolase
MEACILFLIAIQIVLLVSFRNLKSSVRKAQSKSLAIARKNEALLHSMNLSLENLAKVTSPPLPLINIPFADEAGIVLSVKKVSIPFISAQYNASIGAVGNGYLLFFRYDEPNFTNERLQISSHIGCISLDRNFEPLEKECSKIQTDSAFSEDVRFFQNGKSYFLVYNDLIPCPVDRRGIHIGAIDLCKRKLEYVTTLDLDSRKTEKNWTPFSHQGKIHFLYTINPQKILTLPNPRENLLLSSPNALPSELDWSDKWGALRGGTPAQLVDGEYLAFFHSSFEDYRGITWYVMGAYTFAAYSPFKITRISPYPILFEGIYDTPHQVIANPKVRSIYPAGFTCERREDKELIHVSCGENDSGIKIVSMDKNALLLSLKTLGCI